MVCLYSRYQAMRLLRQQSSWLFRKDCWYCNFTCWCIFLCGQYIILMWRSIWDIIILLQTLICLKKSKQIMTEIILVNKCKHLAGFFIGLLDIMTWDKHHVWASVRARFHHLNAAIVIFVAVQFCRGASYPPSVAYYFMLGDAGGCRRWPRNLILAKSLVSLWYPWLLCFSWSVVIN
jgi:hypothetical protein